MTHWWPAQGVKVDPGRPPARPGEQGVPPHVDVPHWLFTPLARGLRHHRIDYHSSVGFIRRSDSDDPDDQVDRLVFPSTDPEVIQFLVDAAARSAGMRV